MRSTADVVVRNSAARRPATPDIESLPLEELSWKDAGETEASIRKAYVYAEQRAQFDVALDGMNVRAGVRGTKYQVGYVPPGPHKIEVSARVGGQILEASELVNVAPGEIAKATLAFPVKKAQP